MVPIKTVSTRKLDIGTNNPNPIGTNTKHMPRRHRIFQNEITHVIKALHRYLASKNTEQDTNITETAALFKVLWRFKEHRTGPPCYPEIDTTSIEGLLSEVETLLALHNC